MKREKLIEITGRVAADEGYAFASGEEHAIGSTVRSYPAAWLLPPAIESHSGRREGETVYRIVMYLMVLPSSAAGCEALWEKLERDALSIVAAIAVDSEVCAVEKVSVTPARGALTANGEVSAMLEAEVKMWYCI